MEAKGVNNVTCRLCANSLMGEYQFLFSSDGDNLAERINSCLPITVKKTDLLPKQVCSVCLENLQHYQNFFYQVLDAEKKLKSLLRQTQVSEKNSNPCIDCPLCLDGIMGVKDGRVIFGPTSGNNTESQKALGHVDNECLAQMIKQELQHAVIVKEESSGQSCSGAMDFEYVCFACGEGFVSGNDISTHDCSKMTAKEEDSDRSKGILKSRPKRNKTASFPKDAPAQCDVCGKEYKTFKSLKDHTSFCHPKVYHKCEICDMEFAKKWLLNTHMRKHTGEHPYRCNKCGKEFISNSHLWNHNNFHHSKRNLKCKVCDATGFYTKQDLENHVRTKHTKERTFHCKVCDKSFMSTGVFYQHRFIHTDIRKYPCTYCNKTFRRWQTLHNHVRIHTGERPFPCDVCGRAFRQRGDMKKHKATQHANVTS